MAGTKFEHSLADRARALDELQQRAEKFQQFSRNFNKEMLSQGQQFMQFHAEFMRSSGQAAGAAPGMGPPGISTAQGQQFSESVARSTGRATPTSNPRSGAEIILMSESIRRRNASAAGIHDIPSSLNFSPDDINQANRSLIADRLQSSVASNQSQRDETAAELRGWNKDPEKRRRRAMYQEYQSRVSSQADLKATLAARHPTFGELSDPLASVSQLSSADRRRADELAATGKATHLRYDITDIPGSYKAGQKFNEERGGLEKRIEFLRQSNGGPGADANKTIATALENMVRKMEVSNNRFLEASANFTKMSADPAVKEDSREYKVALNELRHSIENLTDTNKDLSRTSKAAREAGGGGGGASGDTFTDKYRKYSPIFGAIAGAGAALIGAAARTGFAMDDAVIGGERRGQEARGAIGAAMAERNMASRDMTNPENILKYRANLLFGGRYNYIGTRPTNLMSAATEEISDKMQSSKNRLIGSLGGTAFQTLLSAGQIVGGGAMVVGAMGGAPMTGGASILAAGMGTGMIAAGIKGIAGSFGGSADEAASNRYLQMSGGLEGGLMGEVWRGKAETQRRSQFLQQAAKAETQQDLLKVVDSLQEGEIREKHSKDLPAMQEMQRLIETQQQGAVLVGEYAVRRSDLLQRVFGRAAASPRHRDAISREERTLEIDDAAQPFSQAAQNNVSSAMEERAQLKIERQKIARGMLRDGRHSFNDSESTRLAEIKARVKELALPGGMLPGGDLERAAENLAVGSDAFDRDRYKRIIGGVESAGDYGAVNTTAGTSAKGKYQFINSTRRALEKRLGVTAGAMLGSDKAAADLQEKGMDLLVNEQIATAKSMRNNRELLAAGRIQKMSDVELMAGLHARGAGNFQKALMTGIDPMEGIAGNGHVFGYIKKFSKGYSGKSKNFDELQGTELNPITGYDSVLSRLEMAPHELMQNMNMVTSVMGNRRTGNAANLAVGRRFEGLQASIGDTERMTLLGRSGLGDFQSLVGNVASLNRVSGGQNNLGQLEQILGSAVQAGFDKSRTAQMFVQTTTELAKSLNITNVSSLAGLVGRSAEMMSVSGIADERSLAAAAQGMSAYGNMTSSRGGLVGALKTAQIFSAGSLIGSGAAILSGVSAPEASSMLAEVESGNISNPKLNRLMTLQGGDKEAIKRQLKGVREGGNTVMRGLTSAFGGAEFGQTMTEMTAAKQAGNTKNLEVLQKKFLARANEMGELQGMGGAGGEAWAMQEMADKGIVDTNVAKDVIEQKMNRGYDMFHDPAKQNVRKYLDGLLRDFRGNTKGVTMGQYEEYMSAGGVALNVSETASKKYAGSMITRSTMADARQNDKGLYDAMQKTLQDTDSFELVRGAEMRSAQLEGDVQGVRLTNVTELAMQIAEWQRVGKSTAPRKDNLNGPK